MSKSVGRVLLKQNVTNRSRTPADWHAGQMVRAKEADARNPDLAFGGEAGQSAAAAQMFYASSLLSEC